MRNKGFTLIEVLVAIAILAMITLLIWQSMGGTIASKERFEAEGEGFGAASLALFRISRDLEMAVLFSHVDFLGVAPNGEQRTKNAFIGENIGDQDALTFTSFSHVRHLADAKESDLAEVSYFLEPDPDEGGFFVLKKREASPPDADPKEGGKILTLLGGVTELNFRYYDPVKQEFIEEWDSTTLDFVNRMPRAVEIVLGLKDPRDEEKSRIFTTLAWLEMAPGPNDF